MVLAAAALAPAVLSGPIMPAGSQTIPVGASSEAVVLAGAGNLTPPHFDSGYDMNGNGLFDFLLVNASVQISMPGNFTVFGSLHRVNSTLSISNSTSAGLPVGPAVLTIWFDGPLINQSGVDGRYTVDLLLFNETFALLNSGTHTTQPYSHLDFDGPGPVASIQSSLAATTPTIDGVISSGEWNDSTVVNLTAIFGNTLPAYVLVKNNDTMLYMAYDAIGDTTQDTFDIGSLAFDTGNDAVASNGHEDQFVQGEPGPNPAGQSHWVYSTSSSNWNLRDAPYNQSLPNEAGLESAWSFAASPGLAANHRTYEFAIPLALLASGPGQTLGFFGGSQLGPGVGDAGSGRYSLWPQFSGSPLPLASYGDLILAGAGGGDTTPPTIAINSPASGAIIPVNSITLNWSASDSGTGLDHFELSLDGGAPIRLDANVTGYTVSALTDGNHTVQVTAFDGANNSAAASVTVTVDTTPPVLLITYPGASAVLATGTVTVAWAASDATSGIDHFELSLDGGAVTVLGPAEGNHTFAGLSQGSHTATLVAFDLAGHTTAVARSFTVDTTAPSITLSAPAAGYLSMGNVVVSWAASDNNGLARIEVSLDGGAPMVLGANATTTTLTGISDGPHTIRVQAFDLAGSSASDSVVVTVDTTAPTVSLTAPISGHVLGTSSVQLTWTASDATSGIDHFEVHLDSGAPVTVAAGTASYTFTGVSDGSHSVGLKAFDRAGNTILVSATVTVDTAVPIASLTAPTSGQLFGTSSVQLTWTASDATSGIDHFEVRLDGGTPVTVAAGTATYTFTGLSDGSHTLDLKAFDGAGNTVFVSVSVSVDATAPTVSIVGPASGAVIPSSSSTVTWTAGDAASGIDRIEVRVDGGTAQTLSAGSTTYALSSLSDGTHTVNVTVVDKAGHSSMKSVSFRVDTSFVSPSGPYGIVGLTSIIVLIVVALLAVLLILRRRRRPRAPT
jgi:Bacterial Ig domain